MKRVCLILLSTIFLIGSTACSGDITADSNGKESSEAMSEQVSELESVAVDSEEDKEAESEVIKQEDSEIPSEETQSGDETSEEKPSEEKPSEEAPGEQPAEKVPAFSVQPAEGTYYAIKSVNVRSGPDTTYDKIGSLNAGDAITITGIADTGWLQIVYNGEVGYFAASYAISEEAYLKQLEEARKKQEEQEQASQLTETPNPSYGSDVKADLVASMNVERINNGVGALTEDATLDNLAQVRAQEIYACFDHTRPDGSSCFTVLDGVTYYTAGENIAAGQTSVSEVMTDWMNSPGHRANILNGSFSKVGIGYYTTSDGYRTYWVQLFTG